MSIKELLGLKESQLSEMEIVKKLEEAQKKDLPEVVFTLKNNQKILVKVKKVSTKGAFFNDYDGLYEN
ncbi:hypothetical protein HYX12_03815 [Candidatus Woesearchaeota archaeon]|nr:hypothetical protein [Candidatus Woesearchaeota archaeon]